MLSQNIDLHEAWSGARSDAGVCQSERGAWGEICPDCGGRLPPEPAPLQSWHGARVNDLRLSAQARSTNSPLRHWHLR